MQARTVPQDLDLTLTERELFDRLGWFVEVRWLAGLLALVFMALGWYAFQVRFAALPAVCVILALFFYNAFFTLAARMLYQRRRIRKRWILGLAHAQITCDLLAVAALVHYIGGVENHFIILFVFPMVVASEFFSPKVAYGYATLGMILVNLIGWGEYLYYDTAHYRLEVLTAGGRAPLVSPGAGQHYVFVLQVCFVMTFAVYVTVFIANSIARRLRAREEELERAYGDLQSLEQTKSLFMRKTSHELRAPVGTLQSLLKAALRDLPAEGNGRSLVERAVRRTENMLDLIDDLLRYSRLRTATVRERFEPVELAEIVRSAGELFRAQAEEKGVRFDIDAEAASVLGARDSLTDLVNNLVSNAIRYTPEGGRVQVEVGGEGGEALLVVSDTGIGIPPGDLEHIFDEFFRGEEAKKAVQHGTGLGMTIVQRVVEMHHGRIEVESEVGKGTAFRVHLPLWIEV
ncbi:MAG: HAMP domain-containing sensor histidine kinase [Phycisphaerae bacterium]|nr:HAMP domain-containing sensor histidine kinase [Phycisphaerae bacterium]